MSNESVQQVLNSNKEISDQFIKLADEVAEQYTAALDNVMCKIYTSIVNKEDDSDESLEFLFAELTNTLYFVADQIEHAGINSDVSAASFTEAYNRSYITCAAQKDEKGKSLRTVDENKAIASEETKYEKMVANVQQRAYDVVKYKISTAQTMVGTLSKLLSKRMSDQALTMSAGNRTGVMND